jgi:putative transposase
LRQGDGGTPVGDVCRQLGVSEATFYVWKKKYGKLGVSEMREIRQLRDENARLKRLVADEEANSHFERSQNGLTSPGRDYTYRTV